MTSQEPENPHSAEPDNPDTEVIAVAAPAPVFVDSTGRRSRLLRRLAYAFGVLVMLYGGLISVSLAGGPVRSSAVLPLPGLETEKNDDKPPARPSPTPQPNASRSPKSLFVADSLPTRRTSAAPRATTARLESTRVPSKPATTKPAAAKTPKPTVTTTHPVESATTLPPTPTPTTTTPVVAPVPPGGGTGAGTGTATTSTGTDTGGQGGGSGVGDSTGTSTSPSSGVTRPTASPTPTPSPEASA